jgi:hypothetical protein
VITEEKQHLIDSLAYSPRTGLFRWLTSPTHSVALGSRAGGTRPDGYVIISLSGKRHYAHRLAFLFMEGRIPKNVDHIDGNPNNNRWINLRETTHQENMQNLRGPKSHNRSGFLGVHRRGNRFRAIIVFNKRSIYLGSFRTGEEAEAAHIAAKRKMHAGNTL